MYQTEAEVFAFIYKMPSSCWPPPMSFLFGVADCTSAATWLCLFDVENINEKNYALIINYVEILIKKNIESSM